MRCSIGVMKPVETGIRLDSPDECDAGRLIAAAAAVQDALEQVSPYRFSAPLAPSAAARYEGRSIEVQGILAPYSRLADRHAFMVVEGAGGLLVPLGQDWTMRDLIARLGLPVVVVGRAGLGGINHALLTLESLGRVGLVTKALVLNETVDSRTSLEQDQVASTVSFLRGHARIPVLGPLPYQSELACNWFAAIDFLAQSGPIMKLADLVWRATPESSG